MKRESALRQASSHRRLPRGGVTVPSVISSVGPCPPEDPVAAFAEGWRGSGVAFLWWRPADGLALVASGVCLRTPAGARRSWHGARAFWRAACHGAAIRGTAPVAPTGPVLWYGGAFDPDDARNRSEPLWSPFPPRLAVLPARLLTLAAGRAALTRNTLAGAPERPVTRPRVEPAPSGPGDPSPPAATAVSDEPPGPAWAAAVRQAGRLLAAGDLQKVVLARAKRVEGGAPLPVPAVLRALAAQQRTCTIFAVGSGNACFLGATPEGLVRVSGQDVLSQPLAGSRPRGRDAAEDAALARALLDSEKDHLEHRLVVEAVERAMRGVCTEAWADPAPRLLRLPTVQHLLTRVHGRSRAPDTLLRLVERLHPTPAVGGVPETAALAAIRRLEPRARGWYAGPLGWIDRAGGGEAAVAIRSGVFRGGQALLYAGCGIVAASRPEAELAETETKFLPLLSALGLDPA